MIAALDPTSFVVPDDVLLEAYEHMRFARRLDEAMVRWQRQGIVPAFPQLRGQEAAQVGAALALDARRDMVFPTYRDHGFAIVARIDLREYFGAHFGRWHGGLHDPAAVGLAPVQSVVGGSVLHAVGWALGRRWDGYDGVAIALLGDGASSQGDVHEAMNFAAVLEAPVVFFVQNNGWALSVPLEQQVAGGSVAARGAGYGITGLRVDGDDVEAVYRAMTFAVDEAREHSRPVIVEAFAYRRGPHATSDDPSRYRTLEQERAAGPDPLDRARDAVAGRGLLSPAWENEADERAERAIEELRAHFAEPALVDGSDMFDFVFDEPTPQILAQRARWRAEKEFLEEAPDV